MTEETRPHSLAQHRLFDRRLFLAFILVSAVLIFLLVRLAGAERTLARIQNAQPIFVAAVIVGHMLRHFATAASTMVLSEMFGLQLKYLPLFQANLASQAANRTFSVGGATGLVVRYAYLHGHGMHTGSFAALEVLEDLLSSTAAMLLLMSGVVIVLVTNPTLGVASVLSGGLFIGALALAVIGFYLYHRRDLVERLAHSVSRRTSAVVTRIIGRTLYDRDKVERAVDDFYDSVAHARRDPRRFVLACVFNLLRMSSDPIALYFAFLAIGVSLPAGFVMILTTTSTTAANLSGVPGQIGVMETSLTMLVTSIGISAPVAVSAVLLYRAISFWLPIPLGYLAFLNLRRGGQL